MWRQIRSQFVLIFFLVSYGFALPPQKAKSAQPKPLKPLSAKDIEKANKKALKASSGKSIQKKNQKILKDQAKAQKKANRKAAQANKALQRAHTKTLREEKKQERKND